MSKLKRDLKTGAIRNADRDAFIKYHNRRKTILNDKEKMDALVSELSNLTEKFNKLEELMIKGLTKK